MRSYDDQPSGTVDQLRDLRRNAPAPERRLLRALREAFPHLKWRHQSPVGPFKPDLLCFSERLIVEVDGETHAGREAQDASRTAFLNREGYRVIRFANADLMANLDGVIAAISLSLGERETARRRRAEGESDSTWNEGKPTLAGSPSPLRQAAPGSSPLPMGEGL